MITIGIRAEPKGLTFAVYDSDAARVVNVEMIRIPAAFRQPEGLKYVRSNILDVLREYAVVRAGVRVTEPNAQSISIERVQIEGVVQEAFASSMVEAYYVGQISSISARLGIDRTEFKPLVAGERDYPVERWPDMSPHEREAILCARGAAHV
jgi:septum formation topological specificity factor MinE